MGRRTYESLPDRFRPLPNRRNLVLSTDPAYARAGRRGVPEPRVARSTAATGDCFVIGGGATYAEALPVADRVYATEIDAEIDGDTFFPELPAAMAPRRGRASRETENDHALHASGPTSVSLTRSTTSTPPAATSSARTWRSSRPAGICIFCPEHVARRTTPSRSSTPASTGT